MTQRFVLNFKNLFIIILQVDPSTLFEMMAAAQYFDCPALMNGLAQTIANMIKGKTSLEIRNALFGGPKKV